MSNTKEEVIQVFDRIAENRSWEDLYSGKIDRITYGFVTRQRAVEEMLDPFAAGRSLDIGCGSGDLAAFYVKKGTTYTGVDLSQNMVDRAKANHAALVRQGKAIFQVADCEHLPFKDQEFNVVSAVGLIEYLPDPSQALAEMQRVTQKGGRILITVPHKYCLNNFIRSALKPAQALLFPLYLRLKKQPLAQMKDVRHYRYSESELDCLMERRGFRKITARYSNFHIIPFPLDHLLPRMYMDLSERVDRQKRGQTYKYWASNYIAVYEKL